MPDRKLIGERLVAAFLGGCLLFNYPVLSLFDRGAVLFGIPLIFVYIFAAWAGVIAFMAWFIEHPNE